MKKKMFTILASAWIGLAILASEAHAAPYTIQPGDYLWKIATEHRITVQQLMSINHLSSYSIYPGQVLQLPDDLNVYSVQTGDTLWLIAQKFGIPLQALINYNPQITNLNNIWKGLTINIPQKPDRYLEGAFPLKKNTYQPFTNTYGDSRTWSPDGANVRPHSGVDIFAEKGTPVYSALDGKIVNVGWNQYGGWRVTIKTGDTTAFYYAHLSGYGPGMTMGAQVKKGQLIGYVGNTGYGPIGTEGKFLAHLHFGIYKTNTSPWSTTDPYTYLRWWELNQK